MDRLQRFHQLLQKMIAGIEQGKSTLEEIMTPEEVTEFKRLLKEPLFEEIAVA